MKLQFGVLYRDQRTASAGDLATLLGSYQTWNAETSGHAFDGQLLIGYRGDRITWEEDTETQPFSLGPYQLTFDGRLDNRNDIAARVGLRADRNLPDPVLIAEAYVKCGDSLFPDLIGEFSLVLWSTDKRELTFVRSVDGARPLFYLLDNERLLWCSDIAHLVRTCEIDPKLNERYVWEYLLGTPTSTITPFAAIGVVGAGTVLRFAKGRLLPATKLWEPREIQRLELRSDADYEERFRHELKEAVRVRLRAKGPVFAELSGGLDSSSVVLTGHEIMSHEGSDPRHLQTLSTVYDQSRTCDERYFIKLVEEKRCISSIYVHEHEQRFTMGLRHVSFTGLPNFFHLSPGKYPRFIEHMQKYSARVLLTGFGGDHIFCSEPCPEILIADSLQNGNLIDAHKCCKVWSRFGGVPYFGLLLKRALPLAASPLLPLSLQYDLLKVPSWLNLNGQRGLVFRQSIIVRERGLRPSHRFRIGMAESFFGSISAGHWNTYSYLHVSHPYSHRPLVEFCLAVPMTQMQRNGETRSLLRRASASLLPDRIAKRKGKGILDESFARAAQRELADLGDTQTWQVCRGGFVKPREFSESLLKMQMGVPSESGSSNSALIALPLERFLRSLSLIKRKAQGGVMLS